MAKAKKATKKATVESSQSDQAIERARLRYTIGGQEKTIENLKAIITEHQDVIRKFEETGREFTEVNESWSDLHPNTTSTYSGVDAIRRDLPMALCGMLGIKPGLCDRRFVKRAIELIGPDFPNLRRSALRSLIEGNVDGIVKPMAVIPSWGKKRLEHALMAMDVIETVLHRAGQEGASNGQTET